MKKVWRVFVVFVLVLHFISSCKKDDANPGMQNDLHLVAVISKSPTDSFRFDYIYEKGRITRITTKKNADPATTFFDVTYLGNRIVISKPILNLPDQHGTDTIYLFTDGNGRVMKRVLHMFSEILPPLGQDRSWFMDTIVYNYNADGQLSIGLHNSFDTAWSDYGTPLLTTVSRKGAISYTVESGNLARSLETNQLHQVDRSGNVTIMTDRISEITRTFDYAQSYLNKTDFANAAIQNESNWFSEADVNKNYKYLPNKVSTVIQLKDQNGTVTSTFPSAVTYQFTYNADGLVLTRIDSNAPNRVITYVYGRP